MKGPNGGVAGVDKEGIMAVESVEFYRFAEGQ